MTSPYVVSTADLHNPMEPLSTERVQVREPVTGAVVEVAVNSPQASAWPRVERESKPPARAAK